jgi:hypothetical protein
MNERAGPVGPARFTWDSVFMKIAAKPFMLAFVLWFAAGPAAFAQSGSTPKPPPGITGTWVLELSSKYGKCTGPITINPPGGAAGAHWAAVYAITCDGDSGSHQERFDISTNAGGSYHFAGGDEHPDVFDLNWTQDGKALAGSGSFANQPLSASLHK